MPPSWTEKRSPRILIIVLIVVLLGGAFLAAVVSIFVEVEAKEDMLMLVAVCKVVAVDKVVVVDMVEEEVAVEVVNKV